MLRFVGWRLVRLAISLLVVSFVTFGLLYLAPGSFASISAAGGGDVGLAGSQNEALAEQATTMYGSDTSFLGQYWNWLSHALRLDLGLSYKYPGRSVATLIGSALPISASLAVCAMAVALVVAVPVGMLSAVRRNSGWDYVAMLVTTLGVAIPNYLAAIALVLLLSVGLHLLPTGGWVGPQNAVMPVLALALAPAGVLARYVRSSALEVLREEYVTAAYARGGTRRNVLARHVLRSSLIPLVTVAGPSLAGLMVGTIFIERIFGIPGLGQFFTNAAASRDMPLLMGCTIVFATILMVMNLVVDLLYAMLDPRTKAALGLSAEAGRRRHSGPPSSGAAPSVALVSPDAAMTMPAAPSAATGSATR